MGGSLWRISKKLTEFAAFWCEPSKRSNPEGLKDSAKLWGLTLPPEWTDQKPEEEVFEYLPENYDAINLFLLIQTQWLMGPGGPTGLNHAIALQYLQPLADGTVLCPVDDIQRTMQGLRTIELEILKIRAEK
jgi:hypothetical protein